jgi:hypothetical protein
VRWAFLLSILGQVPPADLVSAAARDLETLPVQVRPYTRYLTTNDHAVLSGHLNGLSRETEIVRPQPLGGLLRLNLLDYGWTPELWDSLAEVDPWHHVKVEEDAVLDWPGGLWDGKHYPAGSFTYHGKKKGKETVLAPWLAESKDLPALIAGTQSKAPLLRGDWFVSQTVIADQRKPSYYDFLGIKDQKDFERLVGFDKTIGAKREHRRVVPFSGITFEPRRAQLDQGIGWLFRTFDNKKAIEKANPIEILDDEFTFDATEQFGPGPNGMPIWLLANNKGELQTKAPDDIVRFRVDINLSCLECHFRGKTESGIKDLKAQPIKELSSVDQAKYLELRRQYLRDNAIPIKQTREIFEGAIKAATGLDGHTYSRKVQAMFSAYEGPVTPERAASDMGMSKQEMVAKLVAYKRATGYLSPTLSILVSGDPIPIRQWENFFVVAMTNVRQVK